MNIKKILVTPEMAKNYLLNCNHHNRPLNQSRVQSYCNDILKGNWKEDTGELIKFSKTGKLLDGQHRLAAIVKTGVSIHFHICFDLQEEIFDVLDTGKARGGKDVFSIQGIKNAALTAAIIQKNFALKNTGFKSGKDKSLSNSELLKIYNQRPSYWDEKANISLSFYKKFNTVISPTLIGGYLSVFEEKDALISNDFFEQLCTGRNITNITIELLRNRLIQNRISKTSNLSTKLINALIIKTWNAYRLNKEIKTLKFDEKVEEFPQIL